MFTFAEYRFGVERVLDQWFYSYPCTARWQVAASVGGIGFGEQWDKSRFD